VAETQKPASVVTCIMYGIRLAVFFCRPYSRPAMAQSINQSINQSKHISIAPYVASKS